MISPTVSSTTTQAVINYCSSNPCLNNGLCYSTGNGYTCVCPPNYCGINCDIQYVFFHSFFFFLCLHIYHALFAFSTYLLNIKNFPQNCDNNKSC